MARFNKVRGKGKKDKENEELRQRLATLEKQLEESRAQISALQDAPARTSDAMPALQKRRRHYTIHDIHKVAYDYYEYMGGAVLDTYISNAHAKARAYQSQIRVAEGRDHFERGAWGPNITPYEDRMGAALIIRLIKEKDRLIDKYTKQMEASLYEQLELAEEIEEGTTPFIEAMEKGTAPYRAPSAHHQQPPADAPLRFEFSEEEKQEYLHNFEHNNGQEMSPVCLEIHRAIEHCQENPRSMSPDIVNIIHRAAPILERMEKDRKLRPSDFEPQAAEAPVEAHQQADASNAT